MADIIVDIEQVEVTVEVQESIGLPLGGNADDVLVKKTDTPFDVEWRPGGGGSGMPGPKGDKGDKGEKGDKGDTGEAGADGEDGLSAYEIAVTNGFVGTEPEWLLSLKGDKGDKGDTGEAGAPGEQGIQGIQGIQGLKGDKGDKGDTGEDGASETDQITMSTPVNGDTNLDTHLINQNVRIGANEDDILLKQNILSEGAFVNGDKTKLNSIEAGAEVNDTGAEIVTKIDTELGSSDWQGGGGSVNTEFQEETYAFTFNYSFDPANPNKFIQLAGNISIELFGTVNGDYGALRLKRATGNETVEFINGSAPINASYPNKENDIIELDFIHTDSGIQWSLINPTQTPVLSQTILGSGSATIDFTKGSIVNFLFSASNETPTIIPPANNTEVILKLRQDAVGSRTMTLPVNFGEIGSTTSPALSTSPNALDLRKYVYMDSLFYPLISVNDIQFDTPPPSPIYGTVINDAGGFNPATSADKAFDGNITTYSSRFSSANAWIGQDYGEAVIINSIRALPRQVEADALKLNGANIDYSMNGTNWTTIHTISGITSANFTSWYEASFTPVSARYWRIYFTQSASYGRITELEFYSAL